MILHITAGRAWDEAAGRDYRGDTLDTEGFIHCSHREQVVAVANARFRGRDDLVLLCIHESRLTAELRYEQSEVDQVFPHIYGPLNADAVVAVVAFVSGTNGTFALPAELG